MADMTLEQQKALVLAKARLRAQSAAVPQAQAAPMTAPVQSGPIPRSYAASEVPGQALQNVIPDAKKVGGAMVEMVKHPIDTAQGLTDLVSGTVFNVLDADKATPDVDELTARYPDKDTALAFIKENPGQAIMDLGKLIRKGMFNVMGGNPMDVIQATSSEEGKQANQRAQGVATQVGQMYADNYGDWEKIKRTVAEKPVQAAIDLSTVLTGAGAGLTKAGATGTGAAVSKVGAVTNPLTLPIKAAKLPIKGLGKLKDAFKPTVRAKEEIYNIVTEGRPQDALNALSNARSPVPGFQPTSAQALADTGLTKFGALAESGKKVLSSEFAARTAQQDAALIEHIRRVGQTPQALETAKALMEARYGQAYGLSDAATAFADPAFLALLDRPAMQTAMRNARTTAANYPRTFQRGQNAPAQPAQVIPNGMMGNRTIPAQPATFAEYPGTSIHYIKKELDQMIKNPDRYGDNIGDIAALRNTKQDFLNWTENAIPEYNAARRGFAADMQPINQMSIGQGLERSLTPVMGEGAGKIRATNFVNAIENEVKTIANNTQSKLTSLDQMMTPQQIQIIDQIRSELSRTARGERNAMAGRAAAPDLAKLGNTLETPQAAHMLQRGITVANDIMRRLQGGITKKLAAELAMEMIHPELAANAVNKMMTDAARRRLIKLPGQMVGNALDPLSRTTIPMNTNETESQRNRLAQ